MADSLINELERIIGFKIPEDGLMKACTKSECRIDWIAFDKKLGDYEGSMIDHIKNKFGQRAYEIFIQLK